MSYSRTPNGLQAVGHWGNDNIAGTSHLPRAQDRVDPEWDRAERTLVLNYVRSGKDGDTFRGFSRCRFCGKANGSSEKYDDKYFWPSGFAHYIEEHGVKPPQDFIDHVRRRVTQRAR